MLAAQRRVEILEALDAAGTLTTDELAQRLRVSGETIRRDLLLLDRERLVRRVHGGAMATPQMRREEPPYSVRAADGAAKKFPGCKRRRFCGRQLVGTRKSRCRVCARTHAAAHSRP